MDFVIELMNSVLNLPDGQVKFFGEFTLQKNYNQPCSSNLCWGSGEVEMTFID